MNRRNEQILETNEVVCDLLRSGTGHSIPNDPARWWKWWLAFNELDGFDKEYEYEVVSRGDSPTIVPVFYNAGPISCLAAGAPRLDRPRKHPCGSREGGRPRAGETHRHRFGVIRASIRTTERRPSPTRRITAGRDTIVASLGHAFWVPKQGWTRTRDLKAGQWLHGAAGRCTLQSWKTAPK